MPLIVIDPDSEKRATFTPGVHMGEIVKVQPEPSKATPGNMNLVWYFRLTDSANGNELEIRAWNPLGKMAGSRNAGWLRNLGIDPYSPGGFDTESLTGTKVAVETELEDDNRNPGQQVARVKNVVKAR